jgi:hypothetical protein
MIDEFLRAERDDFRRQADAHLAAGNMDEFMKAAREYHMLAGMVGYPDDVVRQEIALSN